MENVFFDDSISDEIFKTYDEINQNFDTPISKCESENEKLFDIISQLFNESKLNSIWINGFDNIKIECENKELNNIDNLFTSNNQLEKFIKYLSQMSNQKFGSNNFIIEGNLKSNLLFMGVLPYNYQSVPILLIRKTDENILVDNNYDSSIIKYLRNAISDKLNILLVGKTKSGKTTLLNYLIKNIEKEQKCIIIENSISATNIKSNFPKINITPFYATDEIGDNEILSRKLLNKLLLIEASNLILDELTIGDVSEFLIYIDSYFRGSIFTINAQGAKDAISKIKKMIKYHIYPSSLMSNIDVTHKAINKFYRKMDKDTLDVIILAKADRKSALGVEITEDIVKNNIKNLTKLETGWFEFFQINKEIPKLLNGLEIMELLKLDSPKQLSNIIKTLHNAQYDGIIKTKDDAKNFLLDKFKHYQD